jgi:hypothetical protein
MNDNLNQTFLSAFRGNFAGLLRWSELDAFWTVLKQQAGAGWYIYTIGEAPPPTPLSANELIHFIDELDVLLHSEHKEDYCGIVYVDSKTSPTFIKVYDPNNLGVVCGYSDNPPLPGWIISQLRPVDLNAALSPTQSRRRWWNRIFGNRQAEGSRTG